MITAYTPSPKLVKETSGAIRADDAIIFKLEDKINENHNPYMIETWVLRGGQLISAGWRSSAYPDAFCSEPFEVDFNAYPKATSAETLVVLEEKKARGFSFRQTEPYRCTGRTNYVTSGFRVIGQCHREVHDQFGRCKQHSVT